MSELCIRRYRNGYAIYGDTRLTDVLTFEEATAELAALETVAQEQIVNDPDLRERRRIKAAYREAETPGTTLHTLRKVFPRKGAIKKATDAAYRSLDIFKGIDFDAIERGQSVQARARAVRTATVANSARGSDTEARVIELWSKFTDVPERKRAARIALELNIDVRHVRRLRPR